MMDRNGGGTSLRSSQSPARGVGGVWGMPQLRYNYFDFVVAKPKKYIPNSGPQLLPITNALEHDKTGFIIDKVFFKSQDRKELRYIVGFTDYPQLRVSVKLQNILEWCSAWEVETWEDNDYLRQEKEEEKLLLPAILAKEARKEKRLQKLSAARLGAAVKVDRRKRKRVHSSATETPQKKIGTVQARGPPSFASLRIVSTKGQQSRPGRMFHRPSEESESSRPFTSPNAKRQTGTGLADIAARLTDSSDSDASDSDDTVGAIRSQLRPKARAEVESDSSDPLVRASSFPPQKSPRHIVSANKNVSTNPWSKVSAYHRHGGTIESGKNGRLGKNDAKNTLHQPLNDVTQTRLTRPDLSPTQLFDTSRDSDIDRHDKTNVRNRVHGLKKASTGSAPLARRVVQNKPVKIYKSPFDPPSPRQRSAYRVNNTTGHQRSLSVAATKSSSPQRHSQQYTMVPASYREDVVHVNAEQEGEEEYYVERILKCKREVIDGRVVKSYLIRWEGDWDDTWEPQENVGSVALEQFERAHKNRQRGATMTKAAQAAAAQPSTYKKLSPTQNIVSGTRLFGKGPQTVPFEQRHSLNSEPTLSSMEMISSGLGAPPVTYGMNAIEKEKPNKKSNAVVILSSGGEDEDEDEDDDDGHNSKFI